MAESENPLADEESTVDEGSGEEMAMGDEELGVDQVDDLLGEADHLAFN